MAFLCLPVPPASGTGLFLSLTYFCEVKNYHKNDLIDLLESAYFRYNSTAFIESDPVSIPHRFSKNDDREISGFLASTISWGQRPVIIRNALSLLERMDNQPTDFIRNHSPSDRKQFSNFVHRTFNGTDCIYYLKALQNIMNRYGSLEKSFLISDSTNISERISNWRKLFFSFNAPTRSRKHFGDPLMNSASKKFCMYLRWMVRKDQHGVDFGIWKTIKPSELCIPLDIHSARAARELGLLTRNINDWKAVTELTENLKKFNADDPVRYDYALFGLSIDNQL